MSLFYPSHRERVQVCNKLCKNNHVKIYKTNEIALQTYLFIIIVTHVIYTIDKDNKLRISGYQLII
jgi:hypothetical protein